MSGNRWCETDEGDAPSIIESMIIYDKSTPYILQGPDDDDDDEEVETLSLNEESIENISKEVSRAITPPSPIMGMRGGVKPPQLRVYSRKPKQEPLEEEEEETPEPQQEKIILNYIQKLPPVAPQAELQRAQRVRRPPKKYDEVEVKTDTQLSDNEEEEEEEEQEWIPKQYEEDKRAKPVKTSKFTCKYCHDNFDSYYKMRKHRALVHGDTGRDRKEAEYTTIIKSEPDMNDSEAEEEEEASSSEEPERDEWMPSDYAEYKLKHQEIKTKGTPKRLQWYKCKICCQMFSNYYKLSKHRLEHEQETASYDCKTCEQQFDDIETYTAHLRVHQGKEPYKCHKCERGFNTKEDMIVHEKIHVLSKPNVTVKRYRCDICRKEFRKLCDIERHTRVHTGEKPAECNICHKRFQQHHNLSKHLLTHLHVRPFQCEICNKKFGRVDVLNRHLLTHSMEKPFKCAICRKGFIRQVQLNNHMERFHPETYEDLNSLNMTDEIHVTAV